MTPQEKAKNLVELFTFSCHECDNASISALLAVDEILSFMYRFDLDKDMSIQFKWWQDVKTEIEKL